MKAEYKSNIDFVKEIYPDVYEMLLKVEGNARINLEEAGEALRKAYERFCGHLIKEYNLECPFGTLLSGEISLLSGQNILKLKKTYSYYDQDGVLKKDNGFYVWLWFCNACSHDSSLNVKPHAEASYRNFVLVYTIIHQVFKNEYFRLTGKEVADGYKVFDEHSMMIGRNYIVNYRVPADAEITKCIMEYETISFDDMDEIDNYGIIRMYDKSIVDEKLLVLRDKDALAKAMKGAFPGFNGYVSIRTLSEMRNEASPYYIVIYEFSQKPFYLEQILGSMSFDERVQLCKRIAMMMHTLHSLKTPIYHRNLSYESIAICKDDFDRYTPSLTKFECAKIVSEEVGTVIQNVQNVQLLIQQQKLLKYIAPEIRRADAESIKQVDWKQADIFSLGILMGDILCGKVESMVAQPLKLKKEGCSDSLIKFIDRMKCPNPALRPEIKELVALL